jgi:stage V sporulation protein B
MILSLSNLFLRIFGEIYRIYLIRHLGAEAFGLLGMVFPFYRLVVIFVTMGLPTTLARLTAIENAKNNSAQILETKKNTFFLVTIPATFFSLILFIYSDSMGRLFYNDYRTGPILKFLGLTLLLNSLSIVYHGYFRGLNKPIPLACSNISEILGEAAFVFSILLTSLITSAEKGACLLAKGFLVGESICLLLLLIYDRINIAPKLKTTATSSPIKRDFIGLLRASLPIMTQQLLLSISRITDGFLLPKLLRQGGLTPSLIAKELGEYWSMATPLLFFPLFLFSPVSTLILPATAKMSVKKDLPLFLRKIRYLLGFAFLYGLIVSFLLLRYGKALSLILYKTTSATKFFPFLLPALPFMIINNLLIPIAEGLGKQIFLLQVTLILIVIKTGVSAAFVPLPDFGLAGAAWGLTFSQILFSLLLLKETVFHPQILPKKKIALVDSSGLD